MLKCAEAHNLSPAQLEKLGQTFNTAKTLVGLEKQASRGDSFKIVDVPNLISKYASYSPEKELSKRQQNVHNKVDQLFDEDGWGLCISLDKSASTKNSLPDLNKLVADSFAKMNGGVIDDTDQEMYTVANELPTWSWNKVANAREASTFTAVEGDMKLANEYMDQLAFELPIEISEKCAAIARKLTPDDGRWAEAAEDIYDAYGEKSAAVISAVESYFENSRHHYDKHNDFSKRAFTRSLVTDRHDVFGLVNDIVELQDMQEKIAAGGVSLLEAFNRANIMADADEAQKKIQQYVQQNPPKPNGNPAGKGSGKDKSNGKDAPKPSAEQTVKQVKEKDTSSKEDDEPVIKPAEDVEALLSEMTPSIKNMIPSYDDVINTKPIDKLEDLLHKFGPSKDTRAIAIDRALTQAQMDTTLQQLMLSDPVIADADPAEVQSVFKTLTSVSPTLATDPGKMGPALKEALQYGSVPINILNDAAKFEGQAIKNEADRSILDKNKYSL